MSAKLRMDRRRFLTNTLLGLGAAAMSPAFDFIQVAKARSLRRRHLINIRVWGGWDTNWFHSAMARTDLGELGSLASTYANQVYISTSLTGFESAYRERPYKMTLLHPDEEGQWVSDRGRQHFLGSGMQQFFSPSDRAEMLIWKGIQDGGGHHVANTRLQNGSLSSYAVPYSSLIANHLANSDYVRKLHYVCIAATPADLHLMSAMTTDDGIPICIQNLAAFKGITDPDFNDIANSDRRRLLNEVIAKISGEVLSSQFKKKTSRSIASSFTSAFASAVQLSGSNLATSVEFRYMYKRFLLSMLDGMKQFFTSGNLPSREAATDYAVAPTVAVALKALSPLPNIDAYVAKKRQALLNPSDATIASQLAAMETSLNPALDDVSKLANNPITTLIKNQAYAFAKSAYLVTEDLTAVVDLAGRAGEDPHYRHMEGLMELTCTMAGYRELIRVLKSTPTADGTALLDNTMVVMHSEFNRWPNHESVAFDSSGHPGTPHGSDISVLMAGYGVKRGSIIGDFHHGPKDNARFGANGFLEGLPIDHRTGVVKPLAEGGRNVSVDSLLPTVAKAFGAAVPLQQVTESEAVDAVLSG